MKKKIVIISYFFAPANMIGAIRMTKIAKYLNMNGYDVKVITSENSSLMFRKENGGNDKILSNDVKNIEIIRIKHSFFYVKLANLIRKKFFSRMKNNNQENNKSYYSILKKIILHYGQYLMITIQDFDFLIQAKRELKNNRIENSIIISSFGPLASHLLANSIRKNNKWIADFRDQISAAEHYYIEKLINRIYEKIFVHNCDAVVGVSEDYLKTILMNSNKPKYVITNGYDSSDLNYVYSNYNKKKKLTFCYTGTLYSGLRDITPLFKSLKELFEENKINKNEVEIIYAGPESEYIVNLAKKYDIENIIKDLGFVPRIDSLQIQKESDVIICLTWNVSDNVSYLPGKFLEHLMLKKEILGLVSGKYRNSEMKKIMKDLNIGLCIQESEKNSQEKLKQYIIELYNGKFHHINNLEIQKYDYKNITQNYIELIETI